MSKIPRVIETDEGTMVYCSHEKVYKSVDYFLTPSTRKEGYSFFCDDCWKLIQAKKPNSAKIQQEQNLLESQRILQNLGYEIQNQDNPVYNQFLTRHNIHEPHKTYSRRK